jgi:outer membrane protein assembly factor BamB
MNQLESQGGLRMKNLLPVLAVLVFALTGCESTLQKEESKIMDEPEVMTVNLERQGQGTFYPSVHMKPFKGFVAIADVSTIRDKKADSNLYGFDLSNGELAWKKLIELGYHGRLEYASSDGKVFVRLDGKLTCLDLFTGNIIWQSKENIDWVERAVGSYVYCAGNEENRRNDDTYRTLMCFDVASGENIWQVDVSLNFWSGNYGNDEICYFDWLEDGRNLIIRDAKTGVIKQKIQGADLIGFNYDVETNVLYRLWNDLFMHTPEKEISIFRIGRIDKKIPAEAVFSDDKLLIQTKDNESQMIDMATGKSVFTFPESIIRSKVISGTAYFWAPDKFSAYDTNTGKQLWFLGKYEDVSDQAVLLEVDSKTLRVHSMADGSLISEVKLEGEYYRSSKIDDFGFVVSTEDGKVVLIRLIK